MRNVKLIAVGAVFAVTAVACGGDDRPAGTPTGTGTPTATGTSTGATGQGKFKTGTATLEITGDITKTFTMTLDVASTIYHPPPAGFSASWKSGDDTLGIGGGADLGSRKTGATLILTFVLGSQGFFSGISNKGECTINITKSSSAGLEGTGDCANWKTSDKTVNVKTTFTAAP